MRIHLISIGGSAMHNIAIALKLAGHNVTGSDDEIYEPSRSRLDKHNLLPKEMGWNENRITEDLDFIVLGMHARKDNPELALAKDLNIQIYSYPEFIFNHSKDKKRVVIAGSHVKTTTTSMIMHVLRYNNVDYDYLVGAQLSDFENMVQLSDAPLMIIEGDEYLSSPIDRRPKFLHYKPHLAIITGIAWDHINVFPTFENYVLQFELFVKTMDKDGKIFYYEKDDNLQKVIESTSSVVKSYDCFDYEIVDGKYFLKYKDNFVQLSVFGNHNLQNLKAAFYICKELGISNKQFFEAIPTFQGAAKRLETLYTSDTNLAFLDFAHAPSKAKATVSAVKERYSDKKLIACLELHTFSSLNKNFLIEYSGVLDKADQSLVYYNEHSLKMKRLPDISKVDVKNAFGTDGILVVTENESLISFLENQTWENSVLLMMSSGTFGGLDLKVVIPEIIAIKK